MWAGQDRAIRAVREAQSRALLAESDPVRWLNAAAGKMCLSASLPLRSFLI